MIITIDGPAASGKSTVAQIIAASYSYYYIYSGLFYRAFAYAVINDHSELLNDFDELKHENLIKEIFQHQIRYVYQPDSGPKIFYYDNDITHLLKSEKVDQITSKISGFEKVRKQILYAQRALSHYNLVAEGRDCGTTVFPQADFKFFLTASNEVRAQRWLMDQKKFGCEYSLTQAIYLIQERDNRDKRRIHSPLMICKDAFYIDNSDMNIPQTVQLIKSHISISH